MPIVIDDAKLKATCNSIRDNIDAYCKKAYTGEFRSHMGASQIGGLCPRKIWLQFRWISVPEHSGRMGRIFDRGHREEVRFYEWLNGSGYKVKSVDPATGKQFVISDCHGHFGGSCDGIVEIPELGMECILELKTSKDGPDFKMLFENGVAKLKPQHYAQMSIYGKKLLLEYALYMSINKNNDDIYVELVKLDFNRAEDLIAKAKDLIFNNEPAPKISDSPKFHVCKMCEYYDLCQLDARSMIAKNCRSCANALAGENKTWSCNRWSCIIPEEGIRQGCDSWESIL